MESRLSVLLQPYRRIEADAPPWGLPTAATFQSLELRYGCKFPPSYLEYCRFHAVNVPLGDNAFMWASADPKEDAYASLEAAIIGARVWRIPSHFVPFWEDEGNFYCFDTRTVSADGEFPIVFWDHDDPRGSAKAEPEFASFVEWLLDRLKQFNH